MTKTNPNYDIIAKAIRLEFDDKSGEYFLVFKVTNSQFIKRIRENWVKDEEFELVDKSLVRK